MTFDEILQKLCAMATLPHGPKCPAALDARLVCDCGAAISALKVKGCRENLLTMWNAKVAVPISKGVVGTPTPRAVPFLNPAPATPPAKPYAVSQDTGSVPESMEPESTVPPIKPMAITDFEAGTPAPKLHWKTVEKLAREKAASVAASASVKA